jgi:hypothetical protein
MPHALGTRHTLTCCPWSCGAHATGVSPAYGGSCWLGPGPVQLQAPSPQLSHLLALLAWVQGVGQLPMLPEVGEAVQPTAVLPREVVQGGAACAYL